MRDKAISQINVCGCKSRPNNSGTDTRTECISYTWIDGITYTASNNTATHTLTNSLGCDSVVTLNLTINSNNTGTDIQTACDSYTWIDGITYTANNNSATHTLTNSFGCDSVVTLNLTINSNNTGIDLQTACDSYTWIDGNTYIVNNNTATHTLTNTAGCDSVVTLDLTISAPDDFDEITKLLASDGAVDDKFGLSVSISGNRAIVGSSLDDSIGSNSGAAYIYELNNGSWMQTQILIASDAAAGDEFGYAVSISGDRVIAGSYKDDNGSGSAYIYELIGSTWVESKITPSDGAAGDEFGYTVSISGNRAIVGSLRDDDNGNESGSAYIFELIGSFWVQSQKITPSDGAPDDYFGNAVSIDGNAAVIGSKFDDKNNNVLSSGSAYVFEHNGTNWAETQKITASDEYEYFTFGYSVDISNNYIIVGSPNSADGWNGGFFTIINAGSSYIFEKIGTTWTEVNKIKASDLDQYDNFGWSVSISGNKAIVGSHLDDYNGNNSGSAYIFELDGTSWTQLQKINSSDGDNYDVFGISVSISGNNIIAGAYGNDDNGSESGSAYIFELPSFLDTQTACNSYTWIDGITYTASNNTATYTLINSDGCDSLVTLDLSINNSNTGTDSQSACDSYTWIDGI
ncbi:MAG TPA: hypothetical protein EYN51_06845, partial [Flavobacteriales bacterium]|nr:hypothetical protein [Flavobacteriales bacterium]